VRSLTELLEKYLAMTVSMMILVSLASPLLNDGGALMADCCRLVLAKIILDEIDFGIAKSLRTGRSYENVVLVPSKLSLGGEGSQLTVSFLAFEREIVLSRSYPKPISLRPPITEGSYLLRITSTDEIIMVSFRLI